MINRLVEVIDEDPESDHDSINACYMCVWQRSLNAHVTHMLVIRQSPWMTNNLT